VDLRETTAGAVRIVAVAGELDLASSARLGSALDRLTSDRAALVLDLRTCTFIDSSGLAAVLHGARPLVAFSVVCGDGVPGELLRMTAIDQTIPVYSELDDAIAATDAAR
jgi:anti-anti-sigma factor